LAQLDHFTRQGLEPLPKRLLTRPLARTEVTERTDDRALEVGEGIGPVLVGELLQQLHPLLLERSSHELRDLLLDRAVAATVEVVRDPFGQPLVARLQRAREALAQLATLAFEFRAYV